MLPRTIDRTWQTRVRLFYSGTSGYSELKRSIRIDEMRSLENLKKCYETRKYQVRWMAISQRGGMPDSLKYWRNCLTARQPQDQVGITEQTNQGFRAWQRVWKNVKILGKSLETDNGRKLIMISCSPSGMFWGQSGQKIIILREIIFGSEQKWSIEFGIEQNWR